MRVIELAAVALLVALGLTTWAAIVAGARYEERLLRGRGCTCEHPRDGQHYGTCPLREVEL